MNEENLALLAKAKSKLKTARIDFENGPFEDSISRSYYCAFNAISALLWTKNLNFSSHNQTIGAFNREFVKSGIFPKEYTAILQGLFEDRQASDYDAITTFTSEVTKEAIHNSGMILNSIEKYILKL
ncbi:MAG: HEPN domain-containing protein [Leptospiraceae bacterium]|nr:HEPN domain-containing protein [Leptospiraceae bacterium]